MFASNKMRPSKYCKIIIRRHVVVDNNYEVEQNDASSNSSHKTTTANNNHDHDSENDNNGHVYSQINSFPIATLATGSETWAHFSQRIFNDSVIEASNSSRLLPLLVQLHPNQQRFTAYRLRFGYGYATLIFPTWRRKRRQKQQTRSDEKENNDVDEIIDALLEINVSLYQPSKHHHDDDDENNNSEQSNISTSINTTTTTATTSALSYLAAHERILDSIGVVAYSTTTFIEFHYHSMIGGAFTNQSTILPLPVVKSRTNLCYCVEDENFPGTVGEYDLTTAGKSHFFVSKGGNRSDGGGTGGENRGYSLPKTIVNVLPLEGGLGKSRGINSSSSGTGVYASNGGGLDANSGGSVVVVPTIKTSTNVMIEASSDPMITRTNDVGSGIIMKDIQDLVDRDASSKGGGDQSNGVEIEDESADTSAANNISRRNTAVMVGDIGRNARKRERKKELVVKESSTLAKNCTTSPPFDPPSPARSTVVLDIEASPYSRKRGKVDTNDMKQNDSNTKKLSMEDTSSGTELSFDKPGGTSTTASPAPFVCKLAERGSKMPTANIQTTAQTIANELEGSLQEMENLPKTKEFVNIHTSKQNNIFRKLDDAMSAAMRLTPPLVDSQSNQEPAAAEIYSEEVQSEPSKKKSNIHTTSEKIARDLANRVAGEQKKAFAAENRIPCRARGLPADHTRSTAYFVIPEEIKHGDALLCSHHACRVSKKFRYCQYCKFPIAKLNFARHNRDCVELKKKSNDNQRDADGMIAGDDRIRREDLTNDDIFEEDKKKRTTKTTKLATTTKPKLLSTSTKRD